MRSLNIYTAKERRGMIYLLSLVLVLLGIYLVMPYLVTVSEFDYSEFEDEINSYKAKYARGEEEEAKTVVPEFDINAVTSDALIEFGLEKTVAERWIKYREAVGRFDSVGQVKKIYGLDEDWYTENKSKLQLAEIHKPVEGPKANRNWFSFDPNMVTKEEMQELGFHDLTIQALEKYRAKGGTFYRKEELKYLKGMHPNYFEKLSPYISIDTFGLPNLKQKEIVETPILAAVGTNPPTEVPAMVDINTSNVYQWQMLKGIGPKYAKRIVHYRDKLGGFSSVEQVAETNYLPDSVFQAIKPFLVESPIVHPLEINVLSADSLRLHPYIDWKQASIIENYRKQHGVYQSADDLLKIRVFDTVFIERIRPYLTF